MPQNRYERRSIRSYQKKADHYDETFDGRYTLAFKNLLLQTVQIPDGGKVLDVACGNGRLLQMLSGRHRFSGYGVDISEKMVENAARLNPSMVFRQAGCDALPFEDAAFDVVTVCAAYHHFPDVQAFAAEARRVLAPGGRLYIADVYYSKPVRVMCNPLVRLSPAGDVRFYGPDEITRLFNGNGFRPDVSWIQDHIQFLSFIKQ